MREILFSGKKLSEKDSSEELSWVYGDLIRESLTGRCFILDFTGFSHLKIEHINFLLVEVDPSTVSQFTGMLDKNGKRIFEGHIVRKTFDNTYSVIGIVKFSPTKGYWMDCSFKEQEIVCTGYTNYDGSGVDDKFFICKSAKLSSRYKQFEVIGNIFDNPDLLEVGK
jgi:uncharacterized phage protein (TIGR01671 family)